MLTPVNDVTDIVFRVDRLCAFAMHFSPFDTAYSTESGSAEYVNFKNMYHMRASAYDP